MNAERSEELDRERSGEPSGDSGGELSGDSGGEIVRRAWRAFGTHDAGRIAPFFSEDAEWLAPEGNATAVALGVTHHMVGREQIAHFLSVDFPRLFAEDVSVTFRGIHAVGNVVVVEETMTATLAGGNPYANDYCLVFTLRGGLIHRVREYMDTARGARMVFADAPGVERPAGGAERAEGAEGWVRGM